MCNNHISTMSPLNAKDSVVAIDQGNCEHLENPVWRLGQPRVWRVYGGPDGGSNPKRQSVSPGNGWEVGPTREEGPLPRPSHLFPSGKGIRCLEHAADFPVA